MDGKQLLTDVIEELEYDLEQHLDLHGDDYLLHPVRFDYDELHGIVEDLREVESALD